MGLDLTLQFLLEPGLWRVLLGHVPTGSVLIPMAFLPGLQWEGPEDSAAPNTLLRELTTWDDQPDLSGASPRQILASRFLCRFLCRNV